MTKERCNSCYNTLETIKNKKYYFDNGNKKGEYCSDCFEDILQKRILDKKSPWRVKNSYQLTNIEYITLEIEKEEFDRPIICYYCEDKTIEEERIVTVGDDGQTYILCLDCLEELQNKGYVEQQRSSSSNEESQSEAPSTKKTNRELKEELQMEREEAKKALEKAQEWRERQIKELTEQKDKEIQKLELENQRLKQELAQYKDSELLNRVEVLPK